MLRIGTNLLGSVKLRIRSATNAEDQPAKPLKVNGKSYNGGYPAAKQRRNIAPLRNWTWTGGTLAQMIVKEVSQNRGVIAFANTRADQIAHINNAREKAFGVSPSDREVLRESVRGQVLASLDAQAFAGKVLTAPVVDFSGAGSFIIPSRRSRVTFK
jgi:hypothetical protein